MGEQLEESKYNYTKAVRNAGTESENRRISLKLESCFETTRLPCRLQLRYVKPRLPSGLNGMIVYIRMYMRVQGNKKKKCRAEEEISTDERERSRAFEWKVQ